MITEYVVCEAASPYALIYALVILQPLTVYASFMFFFFDSFGKNDYIRLSPFTKHGKIPPICGLSSWSRFSSPGGNGAHGLLEVHEFFKPCASFDKGDCNLARRQKKTILVEHICCFTNKWCTKMHQIYMVF